MAQQKTYMVALNWQSFNVSLAAIDAKMRAEHPAYVGNQAHDKLELWFTEDPNKVVAPATTSAADDIKAWWNAMTVQSPEALAYVPQSQIVAHVATAKASAMDKLKKLGLSDAEIAAIIG